MTPEENHELGTIENPIVDSLLSDSEALAQNPESLAPSEILERQRVITVNYFGFDGKIHQGQIVFDQDLVTDMQDLFALMLNRQIPVGSVILITAEKFKWKDGLSMAANNSSGFNYRTIKRTGELSNHALGRAIDINPLLNPYVHDGRIEPEGAVYDPNRPGTWNEDSVVVKFLESRGWEWGGKFEDIDIKDYHHFQK